MAGICPKNPEHGMMTPSPIGHHLKVSRRGFSLDIELHDAPGYVCRRCLEENVDTAVLDKRLEKIFNDEVSTSIVRIVQTNLERSNFSVPKVWFDFSGALTNEGSAEEQRKSILTVVEPVWHLDQIYLPLDIRGRIGALISGVRQQQKLFEEWGIDEIHRTRSFVVNFSGPPGTGKSITVDAIAAELGKSLLSVNYSQLESKYVGDTPKNIRQAFRIANERQAVLFFDEADSFLSKRVTEITQSADYAVNISRSVLLQQLETFEGVVFFATNLITNYDKAFERRILDFIDFPMPDETGRESIVSLLTPSRLPISKECTPAKVASVTKGFSGGDLKKVIVQAARMAVSRGATKVEWSDMKDAIDNVRTAKDLLGPRLKMQKLPQQGPGFPQQTPGASPSETQKSTRPNGRRNP